MYSAISDTTERRRQVLQYERAAIVLLVCLLFAFIYPFYLAISGIDTSVPAALQTENKTIYYLQDVIPTLCVGIALLYRRSTFLLRLSPPLLLYCAFGFLSALWSEDPYVSLKFAVRLSLYIGAIAALCELLKLETRCRVLMMMFAFVILASVAMAVLIPSYGTHQATDAAQSIHTGLWRGVFPHKNELGAMASNSTIAFLFFGRLGPSFPGLRFLCLGASIACLIFAGSAGAIASLLVVLILYFAIFVTWRWPLAFTWLFVFAVAAALAGALLATDSESFALLGRDTTLSGRTSIWDVVLAMIADSPLIGHGYYAGTSAFAGPRLRELFGPAIWDAHNGYLTLLLETGVIGLFLYLYAVLSVVLMGTAQAKREPRERRDCLMLLLISPILSLVFAFFEGHPVGEEGCIGTLNFFSLVTTYSYLKQSESTREVAHEWEAGRDVGVRI
ncbi:O-antigen ligase family protein [Bradyrhizobium sp. STM 3562]|uniref:O-antigen ligase family protein n=1 Tax=Bradyrhizobium sp. STM 3562 TaxID=578924 RepID=UPI00388F8507